MQQVEGAVKYISAKDRTTKYGAKKVYALRLEGDDNWYNTGFKSPLVKEGDMVTFVANEDQYGLQVDFDSIEILAKAARPAQSERSTAGPRLSKDDYWKNREARDLVTQKTIQYQAARNAAIAALSAAGDMGILTLPTAKGKQLDEFLNQIDKVTDRYFYNINITQSGEEEDAGEE